MSAFFPAAAGWMQHHRLMRLLSPLGADALLAETATIREVLGPVSPHAGFHIEMTVLCADAHVSLSALLGQAVRLDLQTSHSRTELRPFHGHVTQVKRLGANGGFARYALCVEPWLAFLAHRQDSFIFQQRSVIEIIDAVLSRWVGQGCLNPAWRWDLAEPARYPRRGTTTQYLESDLAFVRRLLAEEGLFCWFEHAADDTAAFGQHTLVISDHNAAFTDNPQPVFRFTQPGATMAEDSVDRWSGLRRLDTAVLAAGSWDYRSLATRDQHDESRIDNGNPLRLAATDDPGQYAWQDRARGQRMLRAQREALDACAKQYFGEGTVRTAAPASMFTLAGHADHELDTPESRHFVVTEVTHHARNNLTEHIPGGAGAPIDSLLLGIDGGLSARHRAALQKAAATQGHPPVGPNASSQAPAHGRNSVGPDSSGQPATEHKTPPVELYRNHFRAIRSHIPWRALMADGHGRHIHPRPTVHGSLTAVVVGPGTPTHTDRDGRVRIQFPWQRGSHSANRFGTSEQDNAPASDALGAWVRVMSPVAGANWGGHWVPRPGQEVLVAFDHGNIDRPVIIGALYNGQGNEDAPGNRIGVGSMAASANAPAFFAGHAAEAHRHNASLSGLKTQQLATSRGGQGGQGGANHLVFDDTPGEARISLGTTEYASALQLGHLKQHHDNARLKDRGHGAELATHAAVAVRAADGLLISADARSGARGAHLDSTEPRAQHQDGKSLTVALAETAAKQKAALAGDAAADKLPASEGLTHAIDTLGATATTGSGMNASSQAATAQGSIKSTAGGEGSVPAWSAPRLQYSAPAGIAQLTLASAILVAGKTLSLAAQDINLIAQGNHSLAVKDGLALFTVGKASGNKPNTETGIALHAASGKVSVQAQSGQLRAVADQRVTVASTTANVKASAKNHLLATAGGAYLKLEGGNIELHAPGPVKLKASMKNLTGPASASPAGLSFPTGSEPNTEAHVRQVFDEAFVLYDKASRQVLAGAPYRLVNKAGEVVHAGITDENGRTARVKFSKAEQLKVLWGH